MALWEGVRPLTLPSYSIPFSPRFIKEKMNDKIQAQLDKQIASKRAAEVVEVSEAPTLTSEIFEQDDRSTSLVEVNFRDMSARLVNTSDAPKLTREVLQVKGKPIKIVETFFNGQMWQVQVRDGKPLSVEVAHLKLLTEYEGQEGDRGAMEERDREIANLLLSKMMADPVFSYKGEGQGPPIEARSPILIESLCNAYSEVNTPTKDEIFQVTVRRGIPADAFALFGESFEFYPVGKSKRYVDMSEDELSAAEARERTKRQVLVSKMIVDPGLSYTPEGHEIDDTEGYPVHLLSERFLKTFYEAHLVTNSCDAGLRSLQRHFRARANTERENASGEPVGNDEG